MAGTMTVPERGNVTGTGGIEGVCTVNVPKATCWELAWG